jgi:hypothetical protein
MRAILLMATMSLMWAMLGCTGGNSAVARNVCGAGNPTVDAAIDHALTRASWFDAAGCGPTGDPLPPTCNRVRLGGDGSYTWTAVSDAPERQQSGTWNFRARDATSGVVCLADGLLDDARGAEPV